MTVMIFTYGKDRKKTHINGMSAIISFTDSKNRKGHGQRDESDVRAGYAIW